MAGSKHRFSLDEFNPNTSKQSNLVPAIEKAINVLGLLESHPNGLSLPDISRELKLPKTTAFRILNTLKYYDFIEPEPDRNVFVLGARILSLATSVKRQLNIAKLALPIMEQLTAITGETSKLAVLKNDEAFVIAVVKSSKEMSITTEVGKRFPLHAGAASKILLAHLPETERNRILSPGLVKYTANTITDPVQLEEALKTIVQQGFADDNEECIEGIKALACPVFDARNRMVAAVSIPYLATKSNMEKRKDLLIHLFSAARDISEALGHGI
jgi:DNA-binding IclR family transcriptional regulator